MGSEGPKIVVIHVTGFKKFNVFATNPTETLVSNLESYVEKKGLPPGISLGSCTVLETAGDGALPMLQKVLESSVSTENNSGSKEVVWLHMGLNGGASKFAIERQAVNEATFSCPDELGWQPKRVPIVPEDGEITRMRETTCSIDAILEFLNKIKGYDATISDDAGRFVCNYRYGGLVNVSSCLGGVMQGVSNLVGLRTGGIAAGQTALKSPSCKVTKHKQACIDNQYVFILFAFDTFCFLAPEVVELLKRV